MSLLEEGQLFEQYSIIRLLGSGVSGESYEAKDSILQQKVTLKLIHPWSILPETAQRQFFREMQGISKLHHPYLASVLDYGKSGGRLYVARRYTSSSSLLGNEGRLWFRSPLAIPDAIRYGHQLAQALAYIHGQGYLHGALTFTNILVLRGPNVDDEPDYAPFLLADVGVANFVRRFGHPQITLLPITAAPEQFGLRVTPASDQFALAVMIFSWLAGRPPYLGSPEEVEHLKLTETIAPLHSLNPNVTAEQENILRRALAVYPDERYPSILTFAETLLATIAPQPQPATQANSVPQLEFTMQPITTPLHEASPAPDLQPEASPTPELPVESPTALEALAAQISDTIGEVPRQDERRDPIYRVPGGGEGSALPTAPTVSNISVPQPGMTPLPELHAEPEITLEPVATTDMPIAQPEATPLLESPTEPQPVAHPSVVPGPAHTFEFLLELLTEPEPVADSWSIAQTEPGEPETRAGLGGQNVATQPEPVAQEELPNEQELPPPTQEALPDIPVHFIITSPYTEEPREVILERDEITLGRAGSSDILLDQDSLTSRHHALLKRKDEHYILYDQRSVSGTFVNGQKLSDDEGHILSDGDHVRISKYELVFRCKAHSAIH